MRPLNFVLWRVPKWTLRTFLVNPISWGWRKLSIGTRVMVVTVPVLFGIFEPFTPAYWLALGMYYESRGEPLRGRLAVANVVYNRLDNHRWPNTVKEVIGDGLERGISCDFSFMCDGKPENPWLHHKKYWLRWLQIRAEAWIIVALRQVNLLYDNTDGAVFYKRKDTYSPWFAQELKAGRMVRVYGDFGAHEFFKMGAR